MSCKIARFGISGVEYSGERYFLCFVICVYLYHLKFFVALIVIYCISQAFKLYSLLNLRYKLSFSVIMCDFHTGSINSQGNPVSKQRVMKACA